MGWLVAIVCVILVVIFWRIFLPVALVVVVAGILFFVYSEQQSARAERRQRAAAQAAEQAVRSRIARASENASDTLRQWYVLSQPDPAGGEKVPRFAGVLSDNGLCRLQVEERINGARLAGIYCSDLEIESYADIQVKFDNRSTSDPMELKGFSGGGNGAYISSAQPTYRNYLPYPELLKRMTEAKKVALLLDLETVGKQWITFSLKGSRPALSKIGALRPKARE
jgi:hypothetical protein